MTTTWVAACALALAGLNGPAWADDRWDGHARRDDWGYGRRDGARQGYERGFREGAKHGAKDGRKGEDFNFWHHRDYRDADKGYKRSYGPRYSYEQAYRRGYEDGYRRGYESRAHDYGYGSGRYDRGRAYGRYDGRHRHPGGEGWCYERHDDDWDDDDRIIYEVPRR